MIMQIEKGLRVAGLPLPPLVKEARGGTGGSHMPLLSVDIN